MTDCIPFRARLDVEYDGYIEPDDDDFDISEGDEAEDRFWAFEYEFDLRVETLEHRGWR